MNESRQLQGTDDAPAWHPQEAEKGQGRQEQFDPFRDIAAVLMQLPAPTSSSQRCFWNPSGPYC
jgi:hypothetical protein